MAAYGAASALYLVFLLVGRDAAARAARIVLGAGVLVGLVDIGARCVRLQNPISSAPEAMAFVAWMIAVGYLGAAVRYRLPAAGAFAVPAALTLLVLARVVREPEATPMGALGRAHILLATVGVAVFTLAAILALLYLFEERKLKRKEFGRMMGVGTPLETLDRLAARCVSLGFPIFTIALVTGAIWIARLGVVWGGDALRPEYVLAVATWVAFGVLLLARRGAGWQGRRAAWLTLGGFGGALLVMIVYLFRHAA